MNKFNPRLFNLNYESAVKELRKRIGDYTAKLDEIFKDLNELEIAFVITAYMQKRKEKKNV